MKQWNNGFIIPFDKTSPFILNLRGMSSILTDYRLQITDYSYAVDIGQIFGPAQKFPTIASLINVLLPNLLLLAGLILFILMLGAGFKLIQGAGSGDAQATEQGKKALTYAIVGFVLIFASFFIIQLVEVLTGLKIFEPGF